jgi:hypothetical protein
VLADSFCLKITGPSESILMAMATNGNMIRKIAVPTKLPMISRSRLYSRPLALMLMALMVRKGTFWQYSTESVAFPSDQRDGRMRTWIPILLQICRYSDISMDLLPFTANTTSSISLLRRTSASLSTLPIQSAHSSGSVCRESLPATLCPQLSCLAKISVTTFARSWLPMIRILCRWNPFCDL